MHTQNLENDSSSQTLKTVSNKYSLLYKNTLATASLGWRVILHAVVQ
jgi:hypothetical protein